MNIRDKTREDLISELKALKQQYNSLNSLKEKREQELIIANYARILIEASLDPLVTISAEGKITDVNEALINVTGIPREKLINTDFSNYFTDPKKAREGYLQVFEKGFVADYQLTIKHENGDLTDVLYNASLYKDDKNKVLGVFAAARDVTEQQWAKDLRVANKELAFQNREKEKRADELIMANKELAFQNEEKEKRAAELIIANKELAYQNNEKEKRAAELATANKELVFQNREKEKRAANLVITNKELQQLIQLNKDKDKFFSIIAHDLRGPFNSIGSLSVLLINQIKKKDYEQIEELANLIHQSSNRAKDLQQNLLVWAQSQSGRMDINPENFDITILIDEVMRLINDTAKQKSILLASTLPSNIQVNADKEMISTVLRNLISNAIKFTRPEGKITISVEEKQSELTVSVSDTGVGILKEQIDKLFNISDSYSTPGTQRELGTGLGLIICKEFINKNNGKIWLKSEAGIGTTFYFSLPLSLENKQNINMLKE